MVSHLFLFLLGVAQQSNVVVHVKVEERTTLSARFADHQIVKADVLESKIKSKSERACQCLGEKKDKGKDWMTNMRDDEIFLDKDEIVDSDGSELSGKLLADHLQEL